MTHVRLEEFLLRFTVRRNLCAEKFEHDRPRCFVQRTKERREHGRKRLPALFLQELKQTNSLLHHLLVGRWQRREVGVADERFSFVLAHFTNRKSPAPSSSARSCRKAGECLSGKAFRPSPPRWLRPARSPTNSSRRAMRQVRAGLCRKCPARPLPV